MDLIKNNKGDHSGKNLWKIKMTNEPRYHNTIDIHEHDQIWQHGQKYKPGILASSPVRKERGWHLTE
ncbi:MAG: hypothetical protein ACLFQS_03980 [Bacteroidales bacterium]